MRKLTTTLLALLLIQLSTAQTFSEKTNAYKHLLEINNEWQNYKSKAPSTLISFTNDIDRISYHLNMVVNVLENNTPSGFTQSELNKRKALLKELKIYAEKKVFPTNLYHSNRTPYFIDDYGVHCAVGELIRTSGNENLALTIKAEHNYNYLADIKTEGLTEWAKTNGFTSKELAWIQPGYPPNTKFSSVGEGTNGAVNGFYTKGNEALYFWGDFDKVDLMPCLNVGYFENGQLNCLGEGFSGQINDVIIDIEDRVIIAGNIEQDGNNYPLAILDNGKWEFLEIPGRIGATTTTVFRAGNLSSEIILSIKHSSLQNEQEIWFLDSDKQWTKKARVNGFVSAIASHANDVFAGHFSNATIYDNTGNIDTIIETNNIVFYDDYLEEWYSFNETKISDTILVAKYFGSNLFIGGTCSNDSGKNNICVSRYFNEVAQPLITTESLSPNNSSILVNDFTIKDQNTLIFCGDFTYQYWTVYGRNLGKIDLATNAMFPITVSDSTITSVAIINDELYVGGAFNRIGNSGFHANHLAKMDESTGLLEITNKKQLTVSPNPFTERLVVTNIETPFHYVISTVTGQVVKEGNSHNKTINDLNDLQKGAYNLTVKTKKGMFNSKLIK
jgi:hypothetical protein